MLTRVRSWFIALVRWLSEAHRVWVTLLVVVAALLLCLRRGVTGLEIRVAGVVLQWLGLGTVALGVRKTRKFFGRPSILRVARLWLARFPRWHRKVVIGAGGASMGISVAAGRAYVWSNIDPAAAPEDQLKALTRNVERLNERLNRVEGDLHSKLRKRDEELRHEEERRAADDRALQVRLEAAETGGLDITLMGIVWLFLGVLLTALSQEIAQW